MKRILDVMIWCYEYFIPPQVPSFADGDFSSTEPSDNEESFR